MPLLKTDDDARHVPSVWLGPPDVMRWPFDASFTQWVIGMAICPFLWFGFGFVIPVALWVVAFAWLFPRNLSKKFPARFPAFIRSPWFYRGALTILVIAIYWENPVGFFLPMNPFVALLFAPIAAFVIVRWVSPHVGPMTPVGYWFSVLVEVLRRPREGGEVSYSVTDHVVSESDEEEGFDLGNLEDFRPKLSLTKKV